MPRIPREEHATIVRRVDVEGHKVAEVAAAYGCTPANIYAILAKMRRQGSGDAALRAEPVSQGEAEAVSSTVPAPPASADLLDLLPEAVPDAASASPPASVAPDLPQAPPERPVAPARSAPASTGRQPPPAAPIRTGRGASAARPTTPAAQPRAAKSGYALVMRTSDGEEAVNPFRSLDELLSAAKSILRTAARSPEPIWFSIQQVDLDMLSEDV